MYKRQDFDETAVSVDDIINAVVSGGYGASVAGKKQEKKDNKIDNEISNMKFRLVVSLVCLVPLMYISMGHMWGWPFLSVFHLSLIHISAGRKKTSAPRTYSD